MTSDDELKEERALLERALAQDEQAVNALVRYLSPKLRLCAHGLLTCRGKRSSRQEADDLVQAAWRELIRDDWRALRSWDWQRGVRLKSYVGAIASNRMISELRRGQRARSEEVTTSPSDFAHLAALADDLETRVSDRQYLEVIIAELATRLTGQGREVFEVMHLEGLSVAQAIKKTGLTRASIYSYRRRIKEMGRSIAEEMADRPPPSSAFAPRHRHG
ncbi:MAG: sigma-70 family RNA polymerase sigma factor [Myxococcota bacterium]